MNSHSNSGEEKETQEQFNARVNFFKQKIPPDDIYILAEQLHQTSVELLRCFNEVNNINHLVNTFPQLEFVIKNVLTLEYAIKTNSNIDLKIDEEFL